MPLIEDQVFSHVHSFVSVTWTFLQDLCHASVGMQNNTKVLGSQNCVLLLDFFVPSSLKVEVHKVSVSILEYVL